MAIPVVLDTFNLYHAVKSKYQKIIDYEKLLTAIKKEHGEDLAITAFVSRQPRSNSFVQLLTSKGCHVQQKQLAMYSSFNVEVTMYMLTEVGSPIAVLASNSVDLVPVLRRLNEVRVTTYVYGVDLPQQFSDYAIPRNISQDMLLDFPQRRTNSAAVSDVSSEGAMNA